MLKYLIGACNYGGHVTDDCDQRLLQTILDDFVNGSVAENPLHQFGPTEAFILPRRLEYREIVRYIDDSISSEPSCELFGLDANADFASCVSRSQELLDSMAIAANMTRTPVLDESEAELCERLNEIINKLPETMNLHGIPTNAHSIMESVLQQEINTYNSLADVVRASCVQVTQAIQGINAPTNESQFQFPIIFDEFQGRWSSLLR